jgi:sulfur transfer protein SufE
MQRPIDAALDELADEFELLGDWEERYRYVIELGKDLAPLSEAEHSEANKVRGCASQVWLVTEPQADGTIVFRGDSDAHIVSGLIAILMRLYSGRPAGTSSISTPPPPWPGWACRRRCRRSGRTAEGDGRADPAGRWRRAGLRLLSRWGRHTQADITRLACSPL